MAGVVRIEGEVGSVRGPALLVVVRHAESTRNQVKKNTVYFADDAARRVLRGTPDHLVELTEAGHEQARQTGQAIRELFGVVDCIYTSGYFRTEQTADGLLSAYTPEERARIRTATNFYIRERDPGYTYDMTEAEAVTAFPWLAEYWQTFGGFFSRPPGGESLADLAARVDTFLATLERECAGQRVLVVAHGGTIRCLRFLLEGWEYEKVSQLLRDDPPINCGVTTYRAGPAGLELEDYNRVYWTVGAPEDGR
jgi:broad specificity phosphatase PhoE